MSLSPKLGILLRSAREKRNLSIRDVSNETKIAIRFIEAMEAEDYSIFPAETYLIGFLSQYAKFLKLHVDEILTIYRNDKMDASAAPIQELIQTSRWYRILWIKIRNYWPGMILVTVVMVFALVFFRGGTYIDNIGLPFSVISESSGWFSNAKEGETLFCNSQQKKVKAITLPASSSPPRNETLSLNPPESLRFTLDRIYFKLCIFEINVDTNSGQKVVTLHLNVNDKENISFEFSERETQVLDRNSGALSNLEHRIKLTPLVIGDYSIRLELETEEIFTDGENDPAYSVSEESKKSEAEGVNIQLTLRFTEDSYLEWVQDGQSYQGRIIPSGEVRTFEARDRLDIKIGNGKGVTLYREGSKPRVLGPAGHIVHLNYTRVPDALDPSVYRILEDISVIR